MSVAARIWSRDPTVWVEDPSTPEVADRLGWLDTPNTMQPHLDALAALGESARGAGRVILAGMGGSSLAPEVMWRTFGRRDGYPALRLWDSTHPDAVPTLRDDDLVLIASKSGTTIETASFEAWAWAASGRAGDRFIAVTDPDTALARRAGERGYRVLLNPPDIGGRFSALSLFGLVPAALMGLDPSRLLADAAGGGVAYTTEPDGPWETLGRRVAQAALSGRDKLVILASPRLAPLGLWLEQLIAESTGKEGKGVLPVIGGGAWGAVGPDRSVVVMTLDGEASPDLDREPLFAFSSDEPRLGEDFFGWAFATAVMGHGLGVNPFDQPDVAAAKSRTATILRAGSEVGRSGSATDVNDMVRTLEPPAYLGILNYGSPSPEQERRMAALQEALVRRTGAVVTAAFGPRYLHSTGQFHKGGPTTGRFIIVRPSFEQDVAIPGQDYTFGRLCEAQAAGDAEALAERGRPVVVVDSLDTIEGVL